MANKNKPVTVVKKPTGRVGGTNTPVKVSKSPTKYTGGKQTPPSKAVPSKGGKKK